MRMGKRAVLYIRRKTGKSVLLLLVMLVLCSFVMLGLLLHHTTDAGIRQTRQSIGGGFRIAPDLQNRDHVTVSTAGGQTNITYIGEPLDEKLVQAVLDRGEITECNAVMRGEALLQEELSLVDCNGRYREDVTASHLVSVEADTSLLLSGLFQTGQVRLTDADFAGRIGENMAVVSEALALQNDLQIGDEIGLFP